MRVGIVSEYVRPWPGGISEHVAHEARELRRRGHSVWILSGPAGGNAASDEDGVVRIGRELCFSSNGARSRMVLGARVLRLRAVFNRLGCDVLHVHAPLDPLLGWAAVMACSQPVAGTFHASFQPGPLWDLLYRGLRPASGRVAAKLDVRIAVSDEARRSIGRYFPGPYELIPNGVDCTRFSPDVPQLPEAIAGGPTVLFVGRADPRKGLPVLLEAFRLVGRRLPDARLIVAGVEPGPLPPAPGITFAGYVAPDMLPRYYASCDVLCAPSTGQESQGIVLLEAMAAARAVVASDIAGYRGVITNGADGLLVPPNDAPALADALHRALVDGALRKRLGAAARQTALRYDWPTVAGQIEQRLIVAAGIGGPRRCPTSR